MAACDRGFPDSQPTDTPHAQLLRALVATDYSDAEGFTYSALTPDGATKALLSTEVRLVFDRFLQPGLTPIRQSLCLRPILDEVKTFNDCSGGVFLEPAYDPVRREVVYRQRTTDSGLAPSTTYKLTVISPADAAATGFRAFDGAKLDANVVFEFTTVASDPPGAKIQPLPTSETWCSDGACVKRCDAPSYVAKCKSACNGDKACEAQCTPDACKLSCGGVKTFFQTCARSCCHASGPMLDACSVDGTVTPAAEGLDLTDLASFQRTALGKVAHETQEGELASQPEETPLRFGRSMPIFDPGNAGNSYALYKAIINGANRWDEGAAPSADEVARLRASAIVGLAMPARRPPNHMDVDDTRRNTQQALDNVSLWLQQGAPTHACN